MLISCATLNKTIKNKQKRKYYGSVKSFIFRLYRTSYNRTYQMLQRLSSVSFHFSCERYLERRQEKGMILFLGGAAAPPVLQQIDRRSENRTRLKPRYKGSGHTRSYCVSATVRFNQDLWKICKESDDRPHSCLPNY